MFHQMCKQALQTMREALWLCCRDVDVNFVVVGEVQRQGVAGATARRTPRRVKDEEGRSSRGQLTLASLGHYASSPRQRNALRPRLPMMTAGRSSPRAFFLRIVFVETL